MLSGKPVIPEYITVHLGPPDSDAENVRVPFLDYVQNVASSEIYPTWPENSLRANIYVITTFALNRIYTEWYRSRGYDFDITNSTQFDQKFIYRREIFENIRFLAAELYTRYIVRQGSIEPLFAQFCNGTTVTCQGLSQWGTVERANEGMTPYEILQYYYGDDIDIITDAAVESVTPSYPGRVLELGDSIGAVQTIQVQLNRISNNFPAIPKIPEPDSRYGIETYNAVKAFQEVFNLDATGKVDEATWYQISYIYTSVKNLAELDSEGLRLSETEKVLGEELRLGSHGIEVENLQYYLDVIGAYYEAVLQVPRTGYFGTETEESVKSFQKVYGLAQTGIVELNTWNALQRAYGGILETENMYESPVELYPDKVLKEGMTDPAVRTMQEYLNKISTVYPEIPSVNVTGYFGPMTKNAVIAFQNLFGIPPQGLIGAVTWDKIAEVYSDIAYGLDKRPYQSPGYTIKQGG